MSRVDRSLSQGSLLRENRSDRPTKSYRRSAIGFRLLRGGGSPGDRRRRRRADTVVIVVVVAAVSVVVAVLLVLFVAIALRAIRVPLGDHGIQGLHQDFVQRRRSFRAGRAGGLAVIAANADTFPALELGQDPRYALRRRHPRLVDGRPVLVLAALRFALRLRLAAVVSGLGGLPPEAEPTRDEPLVGEVLFRQGQSQHVGRILVGPDVGEVHLAGVLPGGVQHQQQDLRLRLRLLSRFLLERRCATGAARLASGAIGVVGRYHRADVGWRGFRDRVRFFRRLRGSAIVFELPSLRQSPQGQRVGLVVFAIPPSTDPRTVEFVAVRPAVGGIRIDAGTAAVADASSRCPGIRTAVRIRSRHGDLGKDQHRKVGDPGDGIRFRRPRRLRIIRFSAGITFAAVVAAVRPQLGHHLGSQRGRSESPPGLHHQGRRIQAQLQEGNAPVRGRLVVLELQRMLQHHDLGGGEPNRRVGQGRAQTGLRDRTTAPIADFALRSALFLRCVLPLLLLSLLLSFAWGPVVAVVGRVRWWRLRCPVPRFILRRRNVAFLWHRRRSVSVATVVPGGRAPRGFVPRKSRSIVRARYRTCRHRHRDFTKLDTLISRLP
mmetsp:Transcript_16317/g.37754  ORF Transcript_16317/g.37754 Transcript_16317/m.37754 type:complete len:604 (+) Transcript_16317:74-1885(+)